MMMITDMAYHFAEITWKEVKYNENADVVNYGTGRPTAFNSKGTA